MLFLHFKKNWRAADESCTKTGEEEFVYLTNPETRILLTEDQDNVDTSNGITSIGGGALVLTTDGKYIFSNDPADYKTDKNSYNLRQLGKFIPDVR
jgi:hypothetical protein